MIQLIWPIGNLTWGLAIFQEGQFYDSSYIVIFLQLGILPQKQLLFQILK